MQKPLKTLTPLETEQLLEQLLHDTTGYANPGSRQRNHLMALLMLDAGLRVGELVKLTLSDLYVQGCPVQTLTVRAEIAKRKHERSIPTSKRLTDALLKTRQQAWHYRIDRQHEYAFTLGINDKHISTRRVQQIISDASLKAFDRKIHPHQLRHTFATRLMQKTNIRVVQQLLGHTSLTSTQIYTHPNNQDLKKAINAI